MRAFVLHFAALFLVIGTAFALPDKIWQAPVVEGTVEIVSDVRKEMLGSGGVVVHLRKAAGIEKKTAAEMFRHIRADGYKPERKTLRDGEIVLLLEPQIAKGLKVGDSIRVTDYVLLLGDGGIIVRPGACKALERK